MQTPYVSASAEMDTFEQMWAQQQRALEELQALTPQDPHLSAEQPTATRVQSEHWPWPSDDTREHQKAVQAFPPSSDRSMEQAPAEFFPTLQAPYTHPQEFHPQGEREVFNQPYSQHRLDERPQEFHDHGAQLPSHSSFTQPHSHYQPQQAMDEPEDYGHPAIRRSSRERRKSDPKSTARPGRKSVTPKCGQGCFGGIKKTRSGSSRPGS